jgi:hypothetical protein
MGCEVIEEGRPRCERPGTMFRGGCMHEHVWDVEVCAGHDAMLRRDNWHCLPCEEVGCLGCPVTLVPLEVDDDAELVGR